MRNTDYNSAVEQTTNGTTQREASGTTQVRSTKQLSARMRCMHERSTCERGLCIHDSSDDARVACRSRGGIDETADRSPDDIDDMRTAVQLQSFIIVVVVGIVACIWSSTWFPGIDAIMHDASLFANNVKIHSGMPGLIRIRVTDGKSFDVTFGACHIRCVTCTCMACCDIGHHATLSNKATT